MNFKTLFALSILLLLLVSCKASSRDYVNKVCDKDYVFFDGNCCLDEKEDGLCDSDRMKDAQIQEISPVEFDKPNIQQKQTTSTDISKDTSTDTSKKTSSNLFDSTGDLRDFFDIFDDTNVPVVIGERGKAYEIQIVNNFMSELVAKGKIPPGAFNAILDTDKEYAQIKNKDHILFGTGCNNEAIIDILQTGECDTLPKMSENQGLFAIFDDGNLRTFVITANNDIGLKKITDYISSAQLKGSEKVI